jgi:hypothetical protein
MKVPAVSTVLLALTLGAGGLDAASSSVPLLYRSDPTDTAAAPRVLAARDRTSGELPARLASAPGGHLVVSFDRGTQTPGRYVYLGFSFAASSPFAVGVVAEKALASVAVTANGQELRSVSGRPDVYATPLAQKGPFSVVLRLERGDASQVPVKVDVYGFRACASLVPNPCGEISAAPPEGLTYDLTLGGDAGPADVLIPAVVRASGLHGPVKSDVTLVNETDAKLIATLALVTTDRGTTASKPVELAPRARLKVTDVVGFLLGDGGDAQGALAVRGFVPASPGGLTAETYYDQGAKGRIGSTLPLFFDRGREPSSILAASSDGDPRLILFSSGAKGGGLAAHVARIRVELGGGAPLSVPIEVPAGVYASARLADLIGRSASDGIVSIETDDPAIHAVLVRSDPGSGTPYLTASN